MKKIDAKGLACPAPVIQTKEIIQEEQPKLVNVIVDNEAARQNVTRFLESQHYKVTVDTKGDDFHLHGERKHMSETDHCTSPEKETDQKKIMIMISTDRIGKGDDDLGQKLMNSFLKTVNEMGPDLWRLIFVNSGVKLSVENSLVLNDLKNLEKTGTKILVCGTCLDHFNLLEKKQVGETTNMLDIVTSMQLADKVINL